jgi:mono/diheme cytochrome c family protein
MGDRKAGLIALLCAALTSFPCLAQSEGQRVFVDEGCAVCHGLMGQGGVGPKLAGDKMLALPETVIGFIVLGAGEMPAFGGKLTDAQIAAVAKYVRESWGNHFGTVSAQDVSSVKTKLKGAQTGGPAGSGAASPASAGGTSSGQEAGSSQESEGQRVYVDAGCAVCHGLNGDGGVGTALRGDKFLARERLVASQILLGGGLMPPFADKLSAAQVAAVASYIRDSWGNHYGKVPEADVARIVIAKPPGGAPAGTPGQKSGAGAASGAGGK